jgi:hypothetical protein
MIACKERPVRRRAQGVTVYYAIALPLIRDLCELMCDGVRTIAERRVAAFGG